MLFELITFYAVALLGVFLICLNQKLRTQINDMALNQTELAAEIRKYTEQTRKGIDEIKAKIAALEETIVNAPVSADVEAAVAELKGAVQNVDDIVPDAPAPAPAPAQG